MSEEYTSASRLRGQPHKWDIDLKWSAWSTDPSVWKDLAPQTFKMLREGFDGGFEEYGETIIVQSAPRKEIRFMRVEVGPSRTEGYVDVDLYVTDTWDSPSDLLATLNLPDKCLDSLEDYLWQHQMIKEDGDPGWSVREGFAVKLYDFDAFMQRVDDAENRLLEESQEAWRDLENWVLKQRMEGCARENNPGSIRKIKNRVLK